MARSKGDQERNGSDYSQNQGNSWRNREQFNRESDWVKDRWEPARVKSDQGWDGEGPYSTWSGDDRHGHNPSSTFNEYYGRTQRGFNSQARFGYNSNREGYGSEYDLPRGYAYDDNDYYSGRPPSETRPFPRGENGRYFGIGPKGYKRSDARIMEDVCECLARDPHVDASQIEVTVSEGEVSLNGFVPSRHMKRRTEYLIESVLGVEEIDNRLRTSQSVGPNAGKAPSDQALKE